MYKAIINVEIVLTRHYNKYKHGVQQEICYENEEDYDMKVKQWQCRCRRLVMEEMKNDDVEVNKWQKLR